jgi:nucleotide-binding universal stress UspA family protein
MYRHILVPVEHSAADRTILDHIVRLVDLTRATLLLVHVADHALGFGAQHIQSEGFHAGDRRRLESE